MLTDFGRFLRKLRIDTGELIKDMAAKLNITASYLSAVETGKRNIPDTWVHDIVRLYDLNQASEQAMIEAAAHSAKTIKLELENVPSDRREAAILFAREFGSMDDATVTKIRELLNRHTKEE